MIVEDNPDLAFGLRTNLELEGYTVEVSADGRAGLEAIRRNPPDLIVLDLMLPGINGVDVLRGLRAAGIDTPVLVLTARGEEADKVLALRSGADDYVTKPFGLLELIARVEALLRRSRPARGLRSAAIEVDPSSRTVRRDGTPVALAPKEFDLLLELVRADGAVVSRHDLLDRIWGYSADVQSRTVDTHVAELRRKLEADPANPLHLRTVRKVGYRWVADPDEERGTGEVKP
jgi:DNA-binding response OmpR family regulator